MPSYSSGRAPYQRVLEQLAEAGRRNAMSTRSGYITDIKTGEDGEQKIRMCWGKTPDGKECKSPWLSTTNMRGEGRERRAFKKGQNVRMQSPNGDFRQAYLTHGPEGESTPAPDHAQDAGEKSETRQNDKTRVTEGQSSHTTWIASSSSQLPEHKKQPSGSKSLSGGLGGGLGGGSSQGQGQQGQGSQGSQRSKGEPAVVKRLTGEQTMGRHVGGDSRYAAAEQGVKLKKKKNEFLLVLEGNIHVQTRLPTVTKPWIIKTRDDPIPDDDKIKD